MNNNFINTQENKGYLWKMLHENGAFNNIDNAHVQKIKNIFEKIVEDIIIQLNSQNYDMTNNNTLLICNKMIIENMINILPNYKNVSKLKKDDLLNNNLLPSKAKTINEIKNNMNIMNPNQTFEDRLKEKQEDFNMLINKSTPPEINFADENDDKPFDVEKKLDDFKKIRNYNDEKIDFKKDIDEMKEKITQQDNIIKILLQKLNNIEKNVNENIKNIKNIQYNKNNNQDNSNEDNNEII